MKKMKLFSLSALGALTLLTSCGGGGSTKSGGETK